MLIAQISDTHIAEEGRKTFGIAPMAENLAACVAHINAQPLPVDVVLVSGDITNDGTEGEARRAAGILAGLDCPCYVIPGNHDDRGALWSVFGGGACPSRQGDFHSFSVADFPVHLLFVDSTRVGAAGGEICEARAAWLERALAESGDKPVVIVLHHPPLKCGVPESDQDGFLGAERFGEIVARHANIERVLCGHIHLHTHSRWAGTTVTTAPSTGMPLALDLTQSHPSEFLLDAPSYLLHHWTPDGDLVTHPVRVASLDGPFPFVERR